MATQLPDITAKVRIDTTGLNSAVKDASTKGTAIGSALGTAVGIGLSKAMSAAGRFLSGSLGEAQEAQKVGAQTAAVIKSTGGAANVAAPQVGSLATSLSNMAGIDDEVIQSGENMLLTFTNIRNAAGKGNDIFDQATNTMLDMSVALGQDTKSSAMQLGKALNDPVKGVTALRRVGVQFTDAQKDQIEKMVKTGDTMGAQKLILHELNREFGGSAKAQATAADKASVSWKNFQEDFGTAMLPVVGTLAKVLEAITGFPGGAQVLVGVLGLLAAAWVATSIASLGAAVGITAVSLPLLAIVAAIALLVVGIIVAIHYWGAISGAATTAMNAIKNAVLTAVNFIRDHWQLMLAILTGPIGAAVLVIKHYWSDIENGAKSVVHGITSAFNGLKSALSSIAGAISGAFKGAWNGIASAWNSTVGAMSFSVPGWVPFLGGKGWDVPDIPHLAAGAVTTGPALAVVGDNPGGRERVQPLGPDGMTTGERQILAALQGNAGTNIEQLVIQNPEPERSTDSLYHTIQKLAVGL